jgi:uncharacterized iron-regulated membrane protein
MLLYAGAGNHIDVVAVGSRFLPVTVVAPMMAARRRMQEHPETITHMAKSGTYRVRQVHRWLGLFIGVQFVLWTLGGFYFSWTDLDEIHGDHLKAPLPQVNATAALASPSAVIDAIRDAEPVDSLAELSLVSLLGRPTYRVDYFSHTDGNLVRNSRLADAVSGALRPSVSEAEAVALAKQAYAGGDAVRSVEYLTEANVGSHHEYREQPLPAWAVTFDAPSNPTAYIAAEWGEVRAIRHRDWRTFDFLWMLHTMDYAGRDNFNNMLLRAFSVLGLVTVLSGFVLFALTSRSVRGRIRSHQR